MAPVFYTGDVVMKRGIILAAIVICLACFVDWAAKASAHRSSLCPEWQKIEADQETQQKRWKAIECEADRMLRDRNINEGVSQTKPLRKRH
jgi:hypothetical protein